MSAGVLKTLLPKILTKVNNNEFSEALQMCESNNKIASRLIPLRGYIYYRLGQYRRTIDICRQLSGAPGRTLGVLHLLAQSHFKLGQRSGDFKEACDIYDNILKQHPKESQANPEFISNAIAAFTAAGNFSRASTFLKTVSFDQLPATVGGPQNCYESIFNSSFIALGQGDYATALQQTQQALDAVLTTLEDDDDECDLFMIQYQQQYIIHLMKENGVEPSPSLTPSISFQDLFTRLTEQFDHLNDSLKTVLLNHNISNKAGFSTSDKPNDLFKQLENARLTNQDKLSRQQLTALQYNIAILQAYTKSSAEMNRILEKLPLSSSSPSSVTSKQVLHSVSGQTALAPLNRHDFTLLIQTFLALREKNYQLADGLIATYTDVCTTSNTTPNPILVLFLPVYIALFRNQTSVALTALTKFTSDSTIQAMCPQLQNHPSIISLFVSLYMAQKDYDATGKYIDSKLKHFEAIPVKQQNSNVQVLIRSLNTLAADVKVQTGDIDGAITALNSLVQSTTGAESKHYLVRIVMLCYKHRPDHLAKYSALLDASVGSSSSLDSEISSIDVESLASQPLPLSGSGSRSKQASSSSSSSMNDDPNTPAAFLPNGKRVFTPEKLDVIRQRKRNRRVKRLPKGLTEQDAVVNLHSGVHIDPYRWKPKWERPSVVAANGKKGSTAHLKRGPQGSGISENTIEFSATGKVGGKQQQGTPAISSANIPAAKAKQVAGGRKKRR